MYTSFPLPCECARRGLGSNAAARKEAGVLAGASTPMRSSRLRGVPQPAVGARGIAAPSCPGILSSNSGESEVALPVSCRGAALPAPRQEGVAAS